MNILVTGAGGFVGKVLCDTLLKKGHQVVGVYRNDQNINVNVQPFIVSDINANVSWVEVLTGVDMVVHLAARAHIITDSAINPIDEFRQTNTTATLKLAHSALIAGVKRFIFISSIGVNGLNSVQPFTENSVVNPSEPYAISKLEAEQGLIDISKCAAMDVVIVRPPLVFGINCPGNFLRLLNLINKNLPLPLGLIKNRRSLINVINLTDFLAKCIDHQSAINQTFLIADEPSISTPELISVLAKGMGQSSLLLPMPESIVSSTARLFGKLNVYNKLCGTLEVDSTFSRKVLGWEQPISLLQGLLEVGQWYSEKMIKND